MVWMILVRSWPAAPTNGSPCLSSSAPGASPTNINAALISPTPNTTFLRELVRFGHFTQTSARSRNSRMASALAAGSSGVGVEVIAYGGFAEWIKSTLLAGSAVAIVAFAGATGAAWSARLDAVPGAVIRFAAAPAGEEERSD